MSRKPILKPMGLYKLIIGGVWLSLYEWAYEVTSFITRPMGGASTFHKIV